MTVIDVMPNGNLLVQGRRRLIVAGEKRTLLVSGEVRFADIAVDNSVQSRLVSNFEMSYEGKGPDSSFSNQGWLGKIVNRLWPF